MAFIPVANAAKVACLFTQYGQKLVNTLWFIKSGGWSATDLTDLAIAINSWVTAEIIPLTASSCSFIGSTAVDMSSAGQEGVEIDEGTPVPGTGGSPGLPSNVTAALKFLTGLTGRSNRGRNFLVGIPAQATTGDLVNSASSAEWVAAYNALADYLVDLGADHVVASLYSGVDSAGKPIPRSAGVVHSVTAYAMDLALDSMRRRLIGRGE